MKKVLMVGVFATLLAVSMVGIVIAQWNGNEYAYNQEDGPLRDGSCQDTEVTVLANDPIIPGPTWGTIDCNGPAPSSGDGEQEGPEWDGDCVRN